MAKTPVVASVAVGADVGTMFYQVARQDPQDKNLTIYQTTRNAFVEIEDNDDIEETLTRNNWQYVKDGKTYYVIGEDSMRVANMFPGMELRRPLQGGVLNAGEDKKTVILTELIRSSIGRAPTNESIVCTCVSSESIDESADNRFHSNKLQGIFKSLGWNVKVIEEGYAVILAENPKIEQDGVEIPYSGIGISFGAGRVNCVATLRGMTIPGLQMSAARSGDWIDARVAEAVGKSVAQVTKIKEKKLDFTNLDYDNDVVFALDTYYGEMIRYVISKFASRFNKQKPEFEAPVEIIIAGGTSMPKGFCRKVEEVIGELDLPFEVKCVRHASDPRNAVVYGCLLQATSALQKTQQDRDKALEASLG